MLAPESTLTHDALLLSRTLQAAPVSAAIRDAAGVVRWANDRYLAAHQSRNGTDTNREAREVITTIPGRESEETLFLVIDSEPAAYESSREPNELYREIFEGSLEAMCCTTADGKFLAANPALARILQYDSPEEMIRSITDTSKQMWLRSEDRARYAEILRRDGSAKRYEFEFQRKDGTPVWVEVSTRRVCHENGELNYYQASISEITERLHLEQERKKSEEKFSRIFRGSPVAMAIANLSDSNRLLDVNEAWEQMIGYSREEAIGRSRVELGMVEPSLSGQVFPRVLANGRVTGFECTFRRKNGEIATGVVSLDLIEVDGEQWVISSTIDITGRILAAEETLRNEERLRLLLNATSDGVWDWHVPSDAAEFTPRCAEMLGRNAEKLPGKFHEWLESLHPEDEAAFCKALEDHFADLGEFAVEYRMKHALTGNWHWILARGSVVERDSEGRPVRMVGTYSDVNDRKLAEQRVQESEAQYRSLVEQASDGIVIKQADGRFREVNTAFCQMLGYSRDELLGMRMDQLIAHPATLFSGAGFFEESETGASGTDNSGLREWILVRRDGSMISVEVSSRSLTSGETGESLSIIRDVSERKKVEWELAESNLRLKMAAEAGGLGIWELDLITNDVIPDARLYSLYGLDPEDPLVDRNSWRNCLHPDDRQLALEGSLRAIRDGFYRNLEFRVVWPNGDIRRLRTDAVAIRDDEGRAVKLIGIAHDVTEEKEAEEERQKLAAQLTQAQKMESIGRLAGGVAHDFNNLLTVINGYSALLMEGAAPDDESVTFLKEIHTAGERAAALTRQLLAFSRQQSTAAVSLELNQLVSENRKFLTRLIGEDVEIVLDLMPEPLRILADPGQIHQVLMNLAVNARDAMPFGGRLLVTTDRQEPGAAGTPPGGRRSWVILTVSDTGTGMSKEVKQRLFEPFFTTKEVGRGTGLGLSTVYGIVQQNGGWIDVETSPGEGSIFRIGFPEKTGNDESAGGAKSSPQPLAGSETVLVVEDQEEVRKFAVAVLERYGYDVIEARNCRTALSIIENHPDPIHLMLADLILPEYSGTELAARAAELHPEMAFLFMSGYPEGTVGDAADRPRDIGHLAKPFTPEALATRVRVALAAPKARGSGHGSPA